MPVPDYNQYYAEIVGWPDEWATCSISAAANIPIGSNPSYTATDLLAFYPKFGGTPTAITGGITTGSSSVTNVSSAAGLAINQLITGPDLASGSIITGISGSSLTLSSNAIATNANEVMNVYTAPFVPLPVLNAYITLASASLAQSRWQEMWPTAMALFIAHFCTLYLLSDGDAASTSGQAAAQGLAQGIRVSQAAGDVSEGLTPIAGLEGWGLWNQTQYGLQLATWANAIGSQTMLIY